MNTNSLKNGQF